MTSVRPKLLLQLAIAAALNTAMLILVSAIFHFPAEYGLCALLGTLTTFAIWLTSFVFSALPRRIRFISIALLVLLLVILWRTDQITGVTQLLYRYAFFIKYFDLYTPVPTAFGIIATYAITALLSGLLSHFVIIKRPNRFWACFLYLVLAGLPYPNVDAAQYGVGIMLLFASLLCFLVVQQALLLERVSPSSLPMRPALLLALPLCAVLLVVAHALPSTALITLPSIPGLPVLSAAPRIAQDTPPWLQSFQSDVYIRLGIRQQIKLPSGDVTTLGGSNQPSDTLLFSVRAKQPMYLYAAVYDAYNSTSWQNTNPKSPIGFITYPPQEWLYEGLDRTAFTPSANPMYTLYGFYNNFTDHEFPVKDKVDFSILYHNLDTDTVLLPRFVQETNMTQTDLSVDRDGIVYTAGARLPDFEYWGSAQTYNLDDLKERDDIGTYAAAFTYESFAPYTALPSSVTQRTRNLSSEILDGYNYAEIVTARGDEQLATREQREYPENLPNLGLVEAVLKVQDYLATEYPYSLEQPALRQGEDFVDQFLFVSQKGYCTSYASAMVVLLRAAGIPARYCEGFLMNPHRMQENVYRVTSAEAHAWVEVAFLGIGWVAFDPTGSSNAAVYRDQQTATPTPLPSATPSPTPSATPTATPTVTPTASATSATPKTDSLHLPPFIENALLLGLLFFILLVPLYAAYAWREHLYRRVHTAAPAAQAHYWYGRILSVLRSEGFTMGKQESMREFLIRVSVARPASADFLPEVTTLMEAQAYGDKTVTSEDLQRFHVCYQQLVSCLPSDWTGFKKFWERYITGRLR